MKRVAGQLNINSLFITIGTAVIVFIAEGTWKEARATHDDVIALKEQVKDDRRRLLAVEGDVLKLKTRRIQ